MDKMKLTDDMKPSEILKPVAKCPQCGIPITRLSLIKEWNATPKAKAGEIRVTIHYWRCPNCGEKFRTATRVWLKQKEARSLGSQKLQKVKQKLSQRKAQGTTR